jgi:hypothetical protein
VAKTFSHVGVIHGELSKVDTVLTAPDLEVMKFLDGGLLLGQHEHDVLLVVLSNDHGHFRLGPEKQVCVFEKISLLS